MILNGESEERKTKEEMALVHASCKSIKYDKDGGGYAITIASCKTSFAPIEHGD